MRLICGICGMNHLVEVAEDGPPRRGVCDICGDEDDLFLALGCTDRAVDELGEIGQSQEIKFKRQRDELLAAVIDLTNAETETQQDAYIDALNRLREHIASEDTK